MKFTDEMTVELITHNLSDDMVVKAARVSTKGADSKDDEANEGLINYLAKNRHMSPFEHGSATFLVHAPIFVAREFMRHRTWSYNEESARYKELAPVFWMPGPQRALTQTGKPGHYKFEAGTPQQYGVTVLTMETLYRAAYQAYTRILNEGVSREVARSVLPVAIYTSFYATANMRNIWQFLDLRMDENAQWEIQDVAGQMAVLLEPLAPLSWAAWKTSRIIY